MPGAAAVVDAVAVGLGGELAPQLDLGVRVGEQRQVRGHAALRGELGAALGLVESATASRTPQSPSRSAAVITRTWDSLSHVSGALACGIAGICGR